MMDTAISPAHVVRYKELAKDGFPFVVEELAKGSWRFVREFARETVARDFADQEREIYTSSFRVIKDGAVLAIYD